MNNTHAGIVGLLAVVMVGFAAGCSGDGDDESGSQGGSISVGIQDNFSHLPMWVAIDQGFMEDHGVDDVSTVNFTQIPAMTAAVDQGQIDAAYQTLGAVASHNESSSTTLKFFAPGSTNANVFVARGDSDIKAQTGDDWQSVVAAWRGRTIGVPALGGVLDAAVTYLATQAGLDPEGDFDVIAVTPGPPAVAAMKDGQIDVYVQNVGLSEQAILEGVGHGVIDLSQGQGPSLLGKDHVSTAYFAPEERIAADDELYAGFAAAIQDGQDFLTDPANRAEVEETLLKHEVVASPEVAAAVARKNLDFYNPDLSEPLVDRGIKVYRALGFMPTPPPTYPDLIDVDVAKSG